VHLRILEKFESNNLFTDQEAWTLFRLAAFGEAFGWTLLIIGISWQKFTAGHSGIPVLLAGKIHGMLFIIYLISAVGLYPALGWTKPKAFIAILASVPPYGTLLFERWAGYRRSSAEFRAYYCCVLLAGLNA
jgi:integral membrane protein